MSTIISMIKNCSVCQSEFITESERRDVCHNKVCRKKRKGQIQHKKERLKNWVKLRSRLQDRHKAILKRAGVPVDRVGLYLKASTRRIKITLQGKFQEGMDWDSYGFNKKDEDGNIIQRCWVVDHCAPCDLFDVSKKEHLEVLWSLDNLRPEWHTSNLQKHSRIDLSLIPELVKEKIRGLGIQLTEKKRVAK